MHRIPHTRLYVSRNLVIYDEHNHEVFGDVIGNVTISFGGEVKTLSREFLLALAYYEMEIPVSHFEHVTFYEINTYWMKERDTKLFPFFSKPIEITVKGKVFRVVPSCCRYAVSEDGNVFDILDGVLKSYNSDSNGYRTVKINYLSRRTSRPLHRLVAEAWVENPNPSVYVLVNHKNGLKWDSVKSNMEWCTFSGNINHAYATGLRAEPVSVTLKHILDGTIVTYASFADVTRQLGISAGTLCEYLKTDRVRPLAKFYEVRVADDESEWYLTKDDVDAAFGARYRYTLFKDGVSVFAYNPEQIADKIGIAFNRGYRFDWWVGQCRQAGYELTRDLLMADGVTYELYNPETKEVKVFGGLKTAAEAMWKVGDGALRACLMRGPNHLYKGWAIRVKPDVPTPWPETFIASHKADKRISGHRTDQAGRPFIAKSIRAMEKITGVNQKAISRALAGNGEITVNDVTWVFKLLGI